MRYQGSGVRYEVKGIRDWGLGTGGSGEDKQTPAYFTCLSSISP